MARIGIVALYTYIGEKGNLSFTENPFKNLAIQGNLLHVRLVGKLIKWEIPVHG